MAFRDLVAYLVIKFWIKSKLPKITLQPKIGLVKIENLKGPISTQKLSPRGCLKFNLDNQTELDSYAIP